MKIFYSLLLMPLNLMAQTTPSYQELIDLFNTSSIPVVRKKIINDDYFCTIYSPDAQPLIVKERLRIRKWGQTDVIISYPGMNLNQVILTPHETSSFNNGDIVLKKISLGHLMIREGGKIFDCFFPPYYDVFWD